MLTNLTVLPHRDQIGDRVKAAYYVLINLSNPYKADPVISFSPVR
jgi:hypothetical protein